MLTIGTKSSDHTQNLPRREAQTVRLESEHSSRNQPKKKQVQRLTLSWTEEDPEVQRWSSLKTQPTDLPWGDLFVAVGHYYYSVYLYIIMHPVCTS